MPEIKAIETIYKGYRFRSRLEARWAVFFDELGIKWEYEPEGFELEDGTMYLPDFYLTDIDAYIEIKSIGALKISLGDDEISFDNGREEAHKYAVASRSISKEHIYIIMCGDPYDVFCKSIGGNGDSYMFLMCNCYGSIILQTDKDFTCSDGRKCCDCKYKDDTFMCEYPVLGFSSSSIIIADSFDSMRFAPTKESKIDMIITGDEMFYSMGEYKTKESLVLCIRAAMKSRQSRFEHGETPS